MKALHLTRDQANNLADKLTELANIDDESREAVFDGFVIRFGDLQAEGVDDDSCIEVTPTPKTVTIGD